MRPKSIATVVSCLRARVSSVISFSVERTVISLIVRISVVLPAAKGPVITIFTAWALPPRRPRLIVTCPSRRVAASSSQPPHPGDQPKQQALVDARVALDTRSRLGRRRGERSSRADNARLRRLLGVGRPARRQERFRAG